MIDIDPIRERFSAVAPFLDERGRRLLQSTGNRKTTEGDSHPDRDAQFGYINNQVTTLWLNTSR